MVEGCRIEEKAATSDATAKSISADTDEQKRMGITDIYWDKRKMHPYQIPGTEFDRLVVEWEHPLQGVHYFNVGVADGKAYWNTAGGKFPSGDYKKVVENFLKR